MRADVIHGAPFKPGDLVETPTGRMARVVEVLPENRRALDYVDDAGGRVSLPMRLLNLVHSWPVQGFRDAPRASAPPPLARYRGKP